MPNTRPVCDNPFFIVGSGRSGSTLLRLILNRHPNLCIPPESWFLLPLEARFGLNSALSRNEISKACEMVIHHRRWPDFDIPAAEFSQHVADRGVNSILGLSDTFFAIHCDRAGKFRWGDKTPPYVKIVPQLLELYPKAKIVYLVRDGRDVAMSFTNARWHGPGAWANTREWIESVQQFASLSRRPELLTRIIRVVYEDLVENSERVTRQVCEFLGESYYPNMLEWAPGEESVVPQRESHAHMKLTRQPQASDLYQWKHSIGKAKIFLLEAYMRNELKIEGYPLRYRSGVWKPLQGVLRMIAPFAARIYQSVVWRYRNVRSRTASES